MRFCFSIRADPSLYASLFRSSSRPFPPTPAFCVTYRQLCNTCLTWLGDSVFSIRVAATDNLKRLADHFGTQWARDHILPKVPPPFVWPCVCVASSRAETYRVVS